MRTIRIGRLLTALTASIVMYVNMAFGWSELSHITINHEAGATTVSNSVLISFGELPDAWPSRDGIHISPYFSWCHNVEIMPQSWWQLWPSVPVYRSAMHEPGAQMLVLAQDKLDEPSAYAVPTALAFMHHNAADGVVHWTYFGGGSLSAWIEHGLKESWANYPLYVEYLEGGYSPTFPPQDIDVGYTNADAGLIHLSQKIFRKNRLSTHQGECGTTHTIDVEGRGRIIDVRLNAKRERVVDDIQGMSAFRRALWGALAIDQGWSKQELHGHFTNAVTAVGQVSSGE